jgi:23S rRNA G2069 N7-methylase RlmK/C1962 C5-methylase RlmI
MSHLTHLTQLTSLLGNPLIYGGAVKSITGDPSAGDDVLVVDYKGNPIGRGFFNPFSQYRVRVIVRNFEEEFSSSMEDVLSVRIRNAISLRRAINLPSASTTAYRLVNGEGDRLGGLIIDVFGNRVVVQSCALWVEVRRSMIMKALVDSFGSEYVALWRQAEARLKQDGYNSSSSSSTVETQMNLADENVVVMENGIKFNVNTENSQKTGFYCDQRDNRAVIGSVCKGKTVLDMYCYSAGFSIYAACNGATKYSSLVYLHLIYDHLIVFIMCNRVTSVDSSIPALDTARLNAKMNGVDGVIEIVKADAVEYMREMDQSKQQFDIVICDPPKCKK